METKTCEVCGQTLPLSAFSKSYKGRCKECVAKLTREKRKGIIAMDKPKYIDWEQRRYEIAKDVLRTFIQEQYPCNLNNVVEDTVRYTDALIKELKKHDNG